LNKISKTLAKIADTLEATDRREHRRDMEADERRRFRETL
jgi:hypothetical protein